MDAPDFRDEVCTVWMKFSQAFRGQHIGLSETNFKIKITLPLDTPFYSCVC